MSVLVINGDCNRNIRIYNCDKTLIKTNNALLAVWVIPSGYKKPSYVPSKTPEYSDHTVTQSHISSASCWYVTKLGLVHFCLPF